MSRRTIFESKFRWSGRRQRSVYLRTVPLHRLTFLLLGVFCIFGVVSCIIDLLSLGQKPLATVLTWTPFTGMMAVMYVLVLIRKPRYILVAVVVHIVLSRLVDVAMHTIVGPMTHPSIEHGVRAASIATLILSMLASVFFLLFIQVEGQHAMRAKAELAVAHSIQETLVPMVDMKSSTVEVYGASIPSDKVGGDLVDVVSLSDGSLFAYVTDIAGHGLPAGILMGMVKTAVRTQLFDLPSPQAMFDRLGAVLPAVKESHMYATCTALRVFGMTPLSTAYAEYAIAGQPAMLHLAGKRNRVERLEDQQFPLGLIPGPAYRGHRIEIEAGDLLLVATDGILESEDKNGEEFGLERVESLLLANRNESLPALAARIQTAVRLRCKQTDDQTLLLIRFLS